MGTEQQEDVQLRIAWQYRRYIKDPKQASRCVAGVPAAGLQVLFA